MKLSELAAAFRAEYSITVTARGSEATDIPDSLLALWISEGIGVVVRSLHSLTSVFETDIRAGESTVLLPADFGTLLYVSLNGAPVYDAVVELTNQPLLNIKLPVNSPGRVVITYTPSIDVFSPSEGRRQNWGALVQGALDGDLVLPDRYVPLMRKYLIAKVLPELEPAFEKELIRQRESAPSGFCHTFKYHFGV